MMSEDIQFYILMLVITGLAITVSIIDSFVDRYK